MKLIPCENCRAQGSMLKNERPYICGRAPQFPTLVHCARCKRKTRVTATMWNRLPDLTAEELERLGVLDDIAKDYTVGGAFTIKEARDLVRAGLTLEEVHELVRP